MPNSAGSASPVSTQPSAGAAAAAMASSVINKLAALPQRPPAPSDRTTPAFEEPSAPNTPPTALHEVAASQSSTNTSGPSHASMSSRSSSMALPFVADDGCSVFFARVPPTKQEEEILEVFLQYGPVHSINLYRRWAASKSSKGCGIVTFESSASADAAIAALHNQFLWPDAAATMVVEKVDLGKVQRDSAERKPGASSSRFQRAASYGSEVHTPASFSSSRDMLANVIAEVPAEGAYLPAPLRTASWPGKQQQQQGRWMPQGGFWVSQQQQHVAKKGHDKHLQQQRNGMATEEQQADSPSQAQPVWDPQGYPTPYPYYYGPNGTPMQYMMYPPGYCYPMSYPHMSQGVYWVPYMPPGGPYTVPTGYSYSGATGPLPAAAAAIAGTPASSSAADDTVRGRQPVAVANENASGSSKRDGVDGKQPLQQHGSGQYPRVVEYGDQALNAKQLTSCIKNCATPEAIHYLVQQHMQDMNHIHISAALGRLAVIAAANHGQHHRSQHQQLVGQLIDHLVKQQLANAKPFELCNSLSAAAKLGYRAPAAQVQQLLAVFVDRLALSKPNEVCTMLAAAARMGQRVLDGDFQVMLTGIVGSLHDCTAKKVQELLRAVNDIGYVVADDQLQKLRAAADESNCSVVIANSMSNLTVSSNNS